MPTVCTEFDVTQLAEHLIGSVTYLGAAAGAGAEPVNGPLETRVAAAAQATLEARGGGSFADPVEVGPDDGLLDRLIAFTGRNLH